MYVAPDTNLTFIKNCPLAENLEHTILFASAGAQQAYFTGLSTMTLQKYSFQRATRNVVRAGIPWDDCLGFNYMMFQNHAHGDKWFYAFITNYEYVNEGCTAITFQIDVLQTYMFDWRLGNCMIERETTPTDEIGEYLLPEGLDVGTPKISASAARYFDIVWLVGSTADLSTSGYPDIPLNANVYDKQALSFQIFGYVDTNALNNVLGTLVEAGKISAIQFLYPAPKPFVELVGEPTPGGTWKVRITSNVVSLGLLALPADLDGYKPKNNKLFTAPFTMARVVSSSGVGVPLKFEYSENNRISISAETSLVPGSPVRAFPLNYDGMPKNYLETCILNGLPLGAFNYDVYARWYAEHQNTINVVDWKNATSLILASAETIGGVVQMGAGALVAGLSGGAGAVAGAKGVEGGAGTVLSGARSILSSYESIYSTMAARADMQILPPATANGTAAGDADLAHSSYGFYLQTITCRAEYAKSIDEFFSRFGYRVNTAKVPTLQNRSEWDYIKTSDTDIGGNVPASALQEIRRAFERGVTFWHNASNFGNYSLNNEPVG